MRSLVPCASCSRHVESHESACPFCGTARAPEIDAAVCKGPCAGHVLPRLGRVAFATVGAALLCAACSRAVTVEYGTPFIPDSGRTFDAGDRTDSASQVDGGQDGSSDK